MATAVRLSASSTELLQAALAVVRERDQSGILDRVLDAALSLTHARYAALAVFDDHGRITRCLHRGLSHKAAARIDMLAHDDSDPAVAVSRRPGAIGTRARGSHRRSIPAQHSRPDASLSVTISSRGRDHGCLVVTRPAGGARFSASDQQALTMLTTFAACALDGALRVPAERERGEVMNTSTAAQERQRARGPTLAQMVTRQDEDRERVSRSPGS